MDLIVLCANSGEGKTSFLRQAAVELTAHGRIVGGVVSPAVFEQGRRMGYDVLDLRSGVRRPLARVARPTEDGCCSAPGCGSTKAGADQAALMVGVYRFDAEALAGGNAAITAAVRDGADVVAIDEVGPLEMRGGGWSPAVEFALREGSPEQALVLTVRPSLADELARRFPSPAWAAARRIVPPWPATLEA